MNSISKRKVFFFSVLAIIVVVGLIRYVLPLLVPFLIGYFIAWISVPMITFLHAKFHVAKNVAAILIITIYIVLFGTIFYVVLRLILEQIQTFIHNFPETRRLADQSIQIICNRFDSMFRMKRGMVHRIVIDQINGVGDMIQSEFIPQFSEGACDIAKGVFITIWNIVIVFLSAVLFAKDFEVISEEYHRCYFYREFHMVTGVLSNMGIQYFKAQAIIICIIAGVCSIGVALIGNHYAVLVGIGIAIFDAFPVLGSAFILIPWALIMLWKKRVVTASILFVTYIVCQFIRQILEPKIVGDCIGVRSVYILMSIYVGIRIYGVFGFVLGPVSLVAIRAIIEGIIERFKSGQVNV